MNKIFISIFIFILFSQIIKLLANDDTYINSSNITYNEKENIVELAENSKINFKNTNILIDKGIIDYDNNEFEVFGNFYLYEDFTILSGQDLKGNISLDIFSANNVNYIYNDDLKIDSDYLSREKNFLYFYNNFLTPCKLEGYFNCPTWSLRIDKTEYDIKEDKFTHFDSFLQIADYKVFYLPYLTHYGAKAPRKRGFLTPTIEFTLGGDQGIITPYYVPISRNTDILFTPKISFNQNLEFLENYSLNTSIENKNSGGNTSISIDNIKNENYDNINTSLKINTSRVLNENTLLSASGLFTNSISTTRSINEQPVTFEDIYLRLENYNFFTKDDYLKTELSSVETFDSTDNSSTPISSSINYMNVIDSENFTTISNLDFNILRRNESSSNNPSESFKINLKNELARYSENYNFSFLNKFTVNNSYSEYYFKNSQTLKFDSLKSNLIISSDLYYNSYNYFLPRLKFILPLQLENTNKTINEDSQSITFNYQNQFSESRFFGNDLLDTSSRIIYGFESLYNFNDINLNFNVNQSFEKKSNNNYANFINQSSKFSDYAIEAKLNLREILLKLDTRLDKNNLSKKEMNYSLNLEKNINMSIIYNETQSEAFKDLSNDTQSIILGLSKEISKNIILSFNSNLDLKNNYDPYSSDLKISIFDECSQLDITYSNTRYNDNYNTKPEETIGIRFSMDYLGFFGFEQSTNLFFEEPGEINNGF